MIDRSTIAFLRKSTISILLGWAIFGTLTALLLVVCSLLLRAALFLLQVISTTAQEFTRLYELQPSIIQLVLLCGLVVLVAWIVARSARSLVKASRYAKNALIDELYRRGRYGR